VNAKKKLSLELGKSIKNKGKKQQKSFKAKNIGNMAQVCNNGYLFFFS